MGPVVACECSAGVTTAKRRGRAHFFFVNLPAPDALCAAASCERPRVTVPFSAIGCPVLPATFASAIAALGPLDFVFNNAGVVFNNFDNFKKTVDINVTAVICGTAIAVEVT